MPFTDDDLKRLRLEYDEMSSDTIAALLARLEAAERLIHIMGTDSLSGEVSNTYEAWRKAAGK